MVVEALPLLKMWYNYLDRNHRRTLNKYVRTLTKLISMNGQLTDVLTDYWTMRKWCSNSELQKSL